MRIVIVDDESVICDGLAKALSSEEGESWELKAVYHDAEEALETCDWDEVDLLLADINMPGIDGLEMVETLRGRGCDTAIVIISGYAQFEYARKALLNNVVDFIIKPVSPDKLFAALRKVEGLLAQRAAERESKLFVESNMDRLLREYFGELIFETGLPSEEQKADFSRLYGLDDKRYCLMAFISGARGESVVKLVEAARGEQGARLYCYPSGQGLSLLLAVRSAFEDFDRQAFLCLAARMGCDIAWSDCSESCGLEELNSEYVRLLERTRDSKAVALLKPMDAEEAEVKLPDIEGDYSSPVARALLIIHEEYSEPLSLTILSGKVCVHPTYLSNLFKKQTGFTLVDYINHYRVERAKELLEDPLNKIYWITEKVGFANQRYFSQVFRKITGSTPVEYRSSHFLCGR